MKQIAANNGVLDLAYIHNMKAWRCWHWPRWRWPRWWHGAGVRLYRPSLHQGNQALGLGYLALYGVAVSGMCVLQLLALKLGQGSEYAVKAHLRAPTPP
jgi:hypothetical protein